MGIIEKIKSVLTSEVRLISRNSLYNPTEADLKPLQKATDKTLERNVSLSMDKAKILNRYYTQVSEVADQGIYGYSTRDEVRQLNNDADIERWLKDPKVRASFQVLISQIFACNYSFEAVSDDDKEQELKRYIDCVFNEMNGTLRNVLKEGVKVALSFQNAFFEKVPKWLGSPEFSGKRGYSALMSKRPGLLEFITDNYDNVLSVHSLVNFDEYYSLDRFFIVGFNGLFSNPYMETLFASTYKFWKAKTIVFQDMAIYSNRYSQPIPTVTYNDDSMAGVAQTISDNLYAGANLALPEGVKAEFIKASEGQNNPFIPILEYLDKQISLGICGIDLSQGSYAADKVISDERNQMVLDIRNDLQDFVFEQLIRPLIKENFDNDLYPIDIYPTLQFRNSKEPLSGAALISVLPVLIDSGAVDTNRLTDLNKIRIEAGFTELTEDEFNEAEEEEEEAEEIEIPGQEMTKRVIPFSVMNYDYINS